MGKNTITSEDIANAVRALRDNSSIPDGLVWIDNEHFYRSKMAELMKFDCTEEEIESAKARDNGFIKSSCGVDLYLSRLIPASK